jgi:hypothetical protein
MKNPKKGPLQERTKKNQEQREERLKREGGEHSPVGVCTVTFAFGFTR